MVSLVDAQSVVTQIATVALIFYNTLKGRPHLPKSTAENESIFAELPIIQRKKTEPGEISRQTTADTIVRTNHEFEHMTISEKERLSKNFESALTGTARHLYVDDQTLRSSVEQTITNVGPIPDKHKPPQDSLPLLHHALLGQLAQARSPDDFGEIQHLFSEIQHLSPAPSQATAGSQPSPAPSQPPRAPPRTA